MKNSKTQGYFQEANKKAINSLFTAQRRSFEQGMSFLNSFLPSTSDAIIFDAEATGCNPKALPGKWLKHSVPLPERPFNDGHLNTYLYLPKEAGDKPLPLLVMLHGCAQTAETLACGSGMNLLAEKYHFAVLYPEQNWDRQLKRCWHWYLPYNFKTQDEMQCIQDAIQYSIHKYSLNAERVYLAGMSAGAAMAGLMAIKSNFTFAGLALHSSPFIGQAKTVRMAIKIMDNGWIAPEEDLTPDSQYFKHPLPILILQGYEDELVNPINAMQIQEWFTRQNQLAMPHNSPKVKLKLIDHLGHAWSGGNSLFPFNQKNSFNSSQEILAFFQLK